MALFRFRTAAIVGEWRPSRREACEDAVRICFARRDPAQPDGVHWIVPAEIEETEMVPDIAESTDFEPGLTRRRA